ncbi:MAG: hypothetical protein IT435_09595 [Phycisphaerales bacterium]|nr:hypothetical protein [Phycisphaerales bacterium]
MKRRAVVSGLVAVGLSVTAYVAWAGDLNPPPGEIAPTMHSLEDIYQAVRASDPCEQCVWDRGAMPLPHNQYHTVLIGSGMLHAVLLSRNESVELWDADDPGDRTDANYLGLYRNFESSTQFLTIDFTYSKGLVAATYSQENKPIVFKYRPN